jgi:hypothetical protein
MSTAQIAQTIAGLIQAQGEQAARAREATGAVWGGALRDIGQTAQQTLIAATDPKRQELQRQQQGRLALTQALKTTPPSKDGTPDHQAIVAKVSAAGFPDIGEAWLSTATKNAENLSSLDKMKRDAVTAAQNVQQKQLETIGDAAFHADTPEKFLASVGYLAAHGQLDEKTANGVLDQAQQAGPDGWKSVREQFLQHSPRWLDEQKERRKPVNIAAGGMATTAGAIADAGGSLSVPEKRPDYTVNGQRFSGTTNQPLGPAVPKQAEPPKVGSEEDFVATYAKEKFHTDDPRSLTVAQKSEALGAFKAANADQEVRAAALAQKNIAEALARIKEGQQPTAEDAKTVAEDLVSHRQSPSQVKLMFGTRGVEGQAFMLKVNTEARKLDPTFNYEEAESNYQLVKSPAFQNTVRYMDSALESIPRLEQNAKNLGNGSFRTLNQLANAAKDQFNSTDLKRFKTDALLVGDEVAKILSGGGTGSATSDAKLKQATDIIGVSDSVPAIAAAMQEVQALMGNRRRALTRGTYMEGSGTTPAPTTPSTTLTPGLRGLANR